MFRDHKQVGPGFEELAGIVTNLEETQAHAEGPMPSPRGWSPAAAFLPGA